MILRETIDKILEVSDCYEVISEFTELKKSGSTYKGLSPFSEEKTPSFVVSISKNIWKDFSSGKGGNALAYLMEARKMSFIEAINYLAKKYNIEVKETKKSNKSFEFEQSRQDLFNLMDFVKSYYYENGLKQDVCATYLQKRGYTKETIKKFDLGYSLDAWNDLSAQCIKNKHSSEKLEEVGLITIQGRKYWDKFRDRIMFPIQDHRNRTVGFGARIYQTNLDKSVPKYINSIETRIYNKSKILYALNHAIKSIVKNNNVYVVEGYTDVISFHQKDVCNTVASCGTALTEEQLRLIKRYTDTVTFVFDGDKAGIKAAFRSIDLALSIDLNVMVVKLDKIDPDELSKTVDDLDAYLQNNLLDFVDYKSSFITSSNLDVNANLINNIVKSLSKVSDPVKRELYLSKISAKFDIKKATLISDAKTFYVKNTRVYHDDKINDTNDVEKLVDLYHNNLDLVINGLTLPQHIYLRISELYNENLYDLDLESMDLTKKPEKHSHNLLSKEEALSQLDYIFKNIKRRIVIKTIDSITSYDADSLRIIQYLMHIKNTL